MKKMVIYRYLGTNGIIESPVHLEDTYYTRLLRLTAEQGKMLTNGERTKREVLIPEAEEADWTEIDWANVNR